MIDKGEGGHANASERRAAIVWPAWYWSYSFWRTRGPRTDYSDDRYFFFFSEDLLDRVASYPITRCHIIMRWRE